VGELGVVELREAAEIGQDVVGALRPGRLNPALITAWKSRSRRERYFSFIST
jgi:hypothetical protein